MPWRCHRIATARVLDRSCLYLFRQGAGERRVNLRWTNKHVQAANKKVSAGTYAADAMIAQQYKIAEVRKYRQEIAQVWDIGIRSHNNQFMADKDKTFIESTLFAARFLEMSFGWDTSKDFRVPHRVFCLPSLSCPGKRVKVRGGAWTCGGHATSSEAIERGVIWGLGLLKISFNVLPKEIEVLSKVVNDESIEGIIWRGIPST